MDSRIGTLARCAYERTEEDIGQRVNEIVHTDDVRRYNPRVGCIHRNSFVLQTIGKVEGKEGQCQFGVAVNWDSPETTLTASPEEVWEVKESVLVGKGYHVHDTAPLPHQGQQETRKQVRTNIVHGYGAL